MEILRNNILKTLLYYDIFSHPLNGEEIFTFLPENSIPKEEVNRLLREFSGSEQNSFAEKEGFYYIKPNEGSVSNRIYREAYSKKMWRSAYFMTHLIKRFPFVRAVMITGTLSKNSSDKASDLDFMIITSTGRLWIARTLLMLFKKTVLLNSKKYFCLNYFITEDSLEIEERNIFTATEIATIKATYNRGLMQKFLAANTWIKKFFPNYILNDPKLHKAGCRANDNRSFIQKVWEAFFAGKPGDRLDEYLRQRTVKHWKKKYPQLAEDERNFRLKSTRTESKTHPHSVQKKILNLYTEKLKQFNL